MGYNITALESTFRIPSENLDAALTRLKDLNHKPGVEKRGYSSGPEGITERWFSWMPADYDKYVTTVEEVLINLGFFTEKNEATGDVLVTGYDSKIGQEELFLNEIADLVDPDSYIIWIGEDYKMWAWTTTGTRDVAFSIQD